MNTIWNPWHGCRKISAGCENCYVYRSDAKYERDASAVKKTLNFDLPLKRNRQKQYKIPPGETVYTCFTSDFLLDEADEWRPAAWEFMRQRSDLNFMFITKRINRLAANLPSDWGAGYDNVIIGCTCENQRCADERLPIFLSLQIKNRCIICEPLLSEIDLSPYLGGGKIDKVVAGGESGDNARPCDYEWVLKLREQCRLNGVKFWFKQTGYRFVKDGKLYLIERKHQHSQARKAGINL
ncbi:MAG: phage Gp37/Gp68 family protein [Oscillospiraceae bacterium]|nr:phage Gp37/Gp68 family protein [Oscillospiraceae bacterium]